MPRPPDPARAACRPDLADSRRLRGHAGQPRAEAKREEVNTISRAWHAAVDAIEEARDIGARGGNVETVRELLQHARELMDVVDAELDEGRVQSGDPDFLRMAAAELRTRIVAVSSSLEPRQ